MRREHTPEACHPEACPECERRLIRLSHRFPRRENGVFVRRVPHPRDPWDA